MTNFRGEAVTAIKNVTCTVELQSGSDALITFLGVRDVALTTTGWEPTQVSFSASDVTIQPIKREQGQKQISEIEFSELEGVPEEKGSWEISWE